MVEPIPGLMLIPIENRALPALIDEFNSQYKKE